MTCPRACYLRWVWEVSQLPAVFVMLGECRDARCVKLAHAWTRRMEEWADHQIWLEKRGNPHAWNHDAPTRERFLMLQRWGGTEDDIEDGLDILNEIAYYGIGKEGEKEGERECE